MTFSPGLLLFASYLLGSIPTSYLAGKVFCGLDLRHHGSGNLGATNCFRVLGAKIAAPVMVVDVLKGFVPVYWFPWYDGSAEWSWSLAYGAAAIVGHVFSIFLRFRGGKGVATGAGVFLALSPVALLLAFLVWVVVMAAGRMVSAASLAGAVTLVIALLVTEDRPAVMALGLAVGTFVIYAHRANIGRLIRGEEHRFGRPRPVETPPPGDELQ